MIIETTYLGRDNPNVIEVAEDGVVVDFSATSRMVLSFKGSTVVADTAVDSTLIDWSLGSGQIQFNLRTLNIPQTIGYSATLVTYDGAHPNGQVIAHSSTSDLVFKFIS